MGEGGGTVVGNGVVVMGRGVWKIKKCSVACKTITSHQGLSIANYSVVNLDKSKVYIDQLYLFMKIINLSRVGIPARLEVRTEHGYVVGTLEGTALGTSMGGTMKTNLAKVLGKVLVWGLEATLGKPWGKTWGQLWGQILGQPWGNSWGQPFR